MFAKLREKIKAKGIRPMLTESFIYSKQYGVGGVFAAGGLLCWNWFNNEKQFARIELCHAETEKWNKKIDDRSRKIILNCESVKRAMLVQAYRDSGKQHVDKSSTRAYQVFLDLLGKESQDIKGELLVLAVDEYKEEEEEEKVGGGGSEHFDGIVAVFKRWFPLPWEYRNQALPQ